MYLPNKYLLFLIFFLSMYRVTLFYFDSNRSFHRSVISRKIQQVETKNNYEYDNVRILSNPVSFFLSIIQFKTYSHETA